MELAERWRWSRGKVERFISYLVADDRVRVKKSNVISCISIQNYEKYQQDKTSNEAANSNDLQNCDTGLTSNLIKLLLKMQEEVSDLRGRLDAQERSTDRKPSKKNNPVNPLISQGRGIFEKRYSDLFDGGVYYWQAKDAAAMDALTKKIIHSRKQKGMSIEDSAVLEGLEALLNSITDQWLLKNFSVTSINGKYNEIVAQARSNLNTINYGENIKSGSQNRRRGSEVTATKAEDYEGSF